MTAPRLVLASGSPRRLEILRGLGLDPVVRPVDVDESPRPGEDAGVYVARLARDKAAARVADGVEPGDVILAADTVVVVDGTLLGKPTDAEDASSMLHRLAGRGHEVKTGVAVQRAGSDAETEVSVTTTRVVFSPMDDAEIRWYVATGEPMDKAGAYAIQGLGALFVERIEGNYSNVVGLPIPAVYRLLPEFFPIGSSRS